MYSDDSDDDSAAVVESTDGSKDDDEADDEEEEEGGPEFQNPLSSLLCRYAEVDDKDDDNEDDDNEDDDIILSHWLKTREIPASHPQRAPPPPASTSTSSLPKGKRTTSLPKGKGKVEVLMTTQTNRDLLVALECVEMGLSCPVYVPLCPRSSVTHNFHLDALIYLLMPTYCPAGIASAATACGSGGWMRYEPVTLSLSRSLFNDIYSAGPQSGRLPDVS
jgi:hypothetical protein